MILNVACDIVTRKYIWVATHPVKGQANSHTRENMSVDGLNAVDWSGLLSQSAYDQHDVAPNPRCPISGWRSQQG